jgi:hypothetical protein
MATLTLPSVNKKLRLLAHGLGLSSLGGAIFLQSTVFASILQNGHFRGVEQNPIILYSEIVLTGIAITYFAYMLIRLISQSK